MSALRYRSFQKLKIQFLELSVLPALTHFILNQKITSISLKNIKDFIFFRRYLQKEYIFLSKVYPKQKCVDVAL